MRGPVGPRTAEDVQRELKLLLGVACPTCGYKYGSAWLTEELPAAVVAEIQSWRP